MDAKLFANDRIDDDKLWFSLCLTKTYDSSERSLVELFQGEKCKIIQIKRLS